MESNILRISITMSFGAAENTVYPTLLRDGQSMLLIDCGFMGSLPLLEAGDPAQMG